MPAPIVQLLGKFVVVVDDRHVSTTDFERPLAAQLVKLLALNGRRLHREQVIDALWPDRLVDEAAPQLHKMASYVRKAVGDKTAIEFRDEMVLLWPDTEVAVDTDAFEALADAGDPAAVAAYGDDLLPDDRYEDWVAPARDRLRERYLSVLRVTEQWTKVLEVEPADEQAHLGVIRGLVAGGQRLAALRQFERLESALSEELGVSPGPEAAALRDELVGDHRQLRDLVGREDERVALRRALDDARAGHGTFLLLTGPAGIGKTALGEWAVDRATELGFVVGQGITDGVDDGRPYGPVLEAISDALRRHPDVLANVPDSHRTEVTRVRDATATDHRQPQNGDGHQRLFVAVDALINATGDAGTVLLIDDLHLADQATIDLVRYLGRRARRQSLVVLATARSIPATAGVASARELIAATSGREVPIGPLGLEDARTLISQLGESPEEMEDLLPLAGGTPFYLEELARTRVSGRIVPTQVAALARRSLDGMDESVRAVLQRAAVAGVRFDTDQFVALSGTTEHESFELLDRALETGAIDYTSGGYRFRHGLVRESLLDDLAPHQRRLIHREAASHLEATDAPARRIAHHLIEAGDVAAAAPWALTAAQAALAVGALADARSVVDSVIDRSAGATRSGLLSVRADAMAGMGDAGVIEAYREALDGSQPEMAPRIRANMARACLMRGDVDTARTAIEGLEPTGGPHDGTVLQAQGMLAYITRDLDTAERRIIQARELALEAGAEARLLDVVTLQGMVAHDRGEWFDRMIHELTATAKSGELATTVFDCHL